MSLSPGFEAANSDIKEMKTPMETKEVKDFLITKSVNSKDRKITFKSKSWLELFTTRNL